VTVCTATTLGLSLMTAAATRAPSIIASAPFSIDADPGRRRRRRPVFST
jgi:hypothetical protein